MKKINKRAKNVKEILIIIILIIVLFLIAYFIIPRTIGNINKKTEKLTFEEKETNISSLNITYPDFNDKKLNKIVNDYLIEIGNKYQIDYQVDYKINILNEKIVNLLFIIKQNQIIIDYRSLIYDFNNNEEKSYDFIVSNKQFLDNYINEALKNKYPLFIYETIINNQGDQSYEIKDNELIIYYTNYDIKPALNEIIYINVNYNEIKEYLKIQDYILDSDYTDPNIYMYIPERKTVAFTFDDGPSKYTKEVYEALKNNHFSATFFVLGNRLNSQKDIVLEMYQNGMEFGSHSYAHPYLTKLSDEKLNQELTKTNEKFNIITGGNLEILRPPYGAFNSTLQEKVNMPLILWSLDTNDWALLDSEKVYNYVINNIEDGDIILMHDSKKTTMEAVKMLLPKLYTMGYQVVGIKKLAELRNKNLEPGLIYKNKIK